MTKGFPTKVATGLNSRLMKRTRGRWGTGPENPDQKFATNGDRTTQSWGISATRRLILSWSSVLKKYIQGPFISMGAGSAVNW